MKHYLAASAALGLISAGSASATGLNRTGQPIGIIFEEGTYVEFSASTTSVDLSGNDRTSINPFGSGTGDVGDRFNLFGAGFKTDLNEQLSFALIFDQPWGADINYPVAGSLVLGGTRAIADSNALTALLRYKFNDRFSIHGGIRYQEVDGEINLAGAAFAGIPGGSYNVQIQQDGAFGWVAGFAYEIPDIALRAALTYSSEITHDFALNESLSPTITTSAETRTPQSVNFDFQTGIAANTLLFGGIRWSENSATELTPTTLGSNLISLDDSISYTLGVGRKFNETWSASIAYVFTDLTGDDQVSPLSPTHGQDAIRLGVQYTKDKMKVSAGLRYTMLGDAIASPGGNPVTDFDNNESLSLGVRVGYSF